MPELPELEMVKEVLQRRVVGARIERVELVPPGSAIVVRNLMQGGFAETMSGAYIRGVNRRGKFLVLTLEGAAEAQLPLYLAINLKLTGRLQLAARGDKRKGKTHAIIRLDNERELRYVDQRVMGQLYLTRDLNLVPDYSGMGPEPFDISLDEFRERLRPYRGEIKGVLTRGEFVAGIGNAYADEILWAAQIHPYRKRTQLKADEIERLYYAMRATLQEATAQVRAEMGEDIHLKPRDFMSVHMRAGEKCRRCGTTISLVGANQRITNFCRTCQPGGLIKGM